ncbi:exocyst complex component 2-like [Hibiscus syriacus]|uniref:Exocyst complex component 2-like n=1 Tax=Hibiscus syriacus TaxID=106335 RepID=A0A6A2WJ72_HIBSY|nr:exocyst complex component 2-like [Hibiscus syriacus]
MGKKRKSIATSLDEAMNQQKLSFQAGKRHSLVKLYQWVRRQQEAGSRNELDYCGEEPSMSPRAPSQQHQLQPTVPFMNAGFMISSGSSCQTSVQGTRPDHCDPQPKNYVFSNALSSPVRRSPQHYHISQEGYDPNGDLPSRNGVGMNESNFLQHQTRDPNPLCSNDTSMDMHSDTSHESTY